MVGARSLAMALNRLIDMGIDAANPRTAGSRAAVGPLTVGAVVAFCAASLVIFLIAVWQLDPVVRWLWPIPVAAFVIYPYLKRFTWLCHLWLGAVDGLAPVGGWVAVTGELPWQAWVLGAAVAGWVAGFDSSTRCSTSRSTAREGLNSWADALRRARRVLGARVLHAADRRVPGRGRPRPRRRRRCTGSACRGRRCCSSTSTRSCARATCAGSTRRSSS